MELDVVILAGGKEGAKLIRGDNKALLRLRDRPLISYVIEAFAASKSIHEIYVVGPAERLEEELKGYSFAKPVHFVQQRTNIFENIWAGFYASLPADMREKSSRELLETEYADKPVFLTMCDTPLILPEEIDDFIESSDMEKADAFIGITQKEFLLPFAPKGDTPGIEFACFCFKEYIARHANVYIVKPLRFAKVTEFYIPLIYGVRYQKQLGNILRAAGTLLKLGIGPIPIYIFICFQVCRFLDSRGLKRSRDFFRKRISIKLVMDYFSRAIQTRCDAVLTSGPGPALDVDNEVDLEIAERMLDKWREIHSQIMAGTYDLPEP